MPLPPPPFVNVAAPVTRPFPEPQILWPTFRGYGDDGGTDSAAFPTLTAIKARLAADSPDALGAFLDATAMAQDRILVLDDYLFKVRKGQSQQSRYDQILSWLPNGLVANDIRFLTNDFGDSEEQFEIQRQFSKRIAVINQRAPRRDGEAKIEIKFSLGTRFPYVHDRFAIIDNELWHFGATVGGLHNQVNAATRGWNATASDAIRFFNEAWNGVDDAK